ncbi:DNA-binding NarL/FixJ family response regulator [Neolewinella xylanilytica]|uniref:DNA-binding NarL/FixJ family response regulator n=1 Tax=Neolewinella xylanilytica TaxID=1514080 RepID=A0A2S6I8V4_9BACT|nr:response regulator transcription factor [Neolewinella xylanilytica]PPK87930.1 DNA-binding NarL/FixJ family response regulator [Neolewinella xylanilytica]
MHPSTLLITGASPIFHSGLLDLLAGETSALQLLVAGDRPTEKELVELCDRSCRNRRRLLIGGAVHPALVSRLMDGGLHGYLLRDATPEKLRTAVVTVGKGRRYIDPDLQTESLLLRPLVEPLTKRERQVLRLIVLEYTTDEIAAKLFISRCTVETHRAHILQKLGVRNTAGIVREAMRRELCAI